MEADVWSESMCPLLVLLEVLLVVLHSGLLQLSDRAFQLHLAIMHCPPAAKLRVSTDRTVVAVLLAAVELASVLRHRRSKPAKGSRMTRGCHLVDLGPQLWPREQPTGCVRAAHCWLLLCLEEEWRQRSRFRTLPLHKATACRLACR